MYKNLNINYSSYYNIMDYWKNVLTGHPSINYVSQGELVDTKEFPSYPFANIIITSANIVGTETIYDCQLVVGDKVKVLNENLTVSGSTLQNIDFYGTSDLVDVHANTFAIINDIMSFTQKATEAFDIPDSITLNAFKDSFRNGVAGWSATFTLYVHNDRNSCLFNLI